MPRSKSAKPSEPASADEEMDKVPPHHGMWPVFACGLGVSLIAVALSPGAALALQSLASAGFVRALVSCSIGFTMLLISVNNITVRKSSRPQCSHLRLMFRTRAGL